MVGCVLLVHGMADSVGTVGMRFVLRTQQNRDALDKALDDYYNGWKIQQGFGKPWEVIVQPETKQRTSVLNAKMFAVLAQLEKVDWYGFKLTRYQWKDMITGSIKQLPIVPNMDNSGFVVCGQSTHNMPSKDIWDIIEAAYAIGTSKGIRFVEPTEDRSNATRETRSAPILENPPKVK